MAQEQKSTQMSKEEIEAMSFKEGLEKLEGIVGQLESNQLELEDSIESYKLGVEVLADLQKRLDTAQLTITELMGKLDDADTGEIDTKLS